MIRLRAGWTVLLLVAAGNGCALAAEAPDFQTRRAKAIELASSNDPRSEDALRVLLREAPDDSLLQFRYGYRLLVHALLLKPGPDQKKMVLEGRSYLLKAKAAGFDEPLIDSALKSYHEDGTIAQDAAYATNARANDFIKDAESAFAVGKFDQALKNYQKALEIEPRNFSATLYVGDSYFALHRMDEAIAWYNKAIALQPNLETPYRYRADALSRLGRSREALDSYIAAVVADPYNRLTWHNLTGAAQTQGFDVRFHATRISTVKINPEADKKEIILPDKAGVLDLAYATARSEWIEQNHALAFPNGHYRQSLAEEKAALERLLVLVAELRKNAGELDPDVARIETDLRDLQHMADAGLLESHILLTRANADLAQDYAAYREQNRDKIAAYLRQYYVGGK